mgnify:CR=1 FL=1
MKTLLKGGTIYNAVVPEGKKQDLLFEDGKITQIAENLQPENDCRVIPVDGLRLYPGFIDAHCHVGLFDFATRLHDYNEYTDPVTPQLRAIDAFNPFAPAVKQAAQGGVTTFATGPGSANVVCGTFFAVKPFGVRVDKMIVKNPIAMKVAFGENPRSCYKGKSIDSRMSIAAKLRDILFQTRQYMEKKEKAEKEKTDPPNFDMKLEAMIPVLKREIPLKVHAHQANDMFTAIRIAREFDLKITLDHCTEGHLVAEELAQEGFPVAVGPTQGAPYKLELQNKTFKTPGILAKAGCSVSIITDADVIESQYLPLMAAFAIQSGMEPFEALKAITANPAKMLGLDDRIGTLEVGKDADILVTTADPLSEFPVNTFKYIFINGNEVNLNNEPTGTIQK